VVGIHAFVDEGLGHSSYLIDLGDGVAALLDPPRFPIGHESFAERKHLRIAWTIDTHSHADYVTGSPGLAARTGATFIAPAASRFEIPHQPVGDGDRIALNPDVSIVAVATPGHTPDHHAYVIEESGQPVALFTGGSLMVGTVGRTDLCGPELAKPLAHDMYRSLRRFDDLGDDLPVYPTHGAGSFCSAPGAAARTSTLGRERSTNPLFQITDEAEFVERLLAGFGTFPTYFSRLPELNRRGPRCYDALPTLEHLDADAVELQIAAGALLVDVRPFAAFGAGHVPGSLSNALRPVFASWLGWLVASDRPVVFVLDQGQDRAELVRQCLDIGHEVLAGELDGGIDAWTASGRPLAYVPVVGIDHLSQVVVDVRQRDEYLAGHVPDARNIELGALPHVTALEGLVTVMCGHGERAMTAASILLAPGDPASGHPATGHPNVTVFDGGPDT
jgi:glyoxylase-like metal-dependent hydrolase (beta-lactamase superfamily II)/rhodanese-related sulfurtransferase